MAPKVPFVQNFRDVMRDAHVKVRDATSRSAKTQKTYYDSKSKRLKFVTGQLVWLYWPKPMVRQKFRKLWKPWTGPWVIESFKSPVVVCVKRISGKPTRQTVNIDRLLPCSATPSSWIPHPVRTICHRKLHPIALSYSLRIPKI